MSRILRETVQREGEEREILIEVEEGARGGVGYEDYGQMRDELGTLPGKSFEKAMDLIRTCAEQVADTVEKVSAAARPSEVEVELGIKFNGEVGALISKTGVEAHLQVTLKWSGKGKA